jgi:glycolate oxidase iron-sulfur subunit
MELDHAVPGYENILNCTRCGLCLSACPTYRESTLETESPRGRVALIKAVADGNLGASKNFEHFMYVCLECRACESVCPTGVKAGQLVVQARTQLEERRDRQPLGRRLFRWALFEQLFPYPVRLERFMLLMRLYQRLRLYKLVRGLHILQPFPTLDLMERFLPWLPSRPLHRELKYEELPEGNAPAVKGRVGFFLGCIMTLVLAEASRATVDVLKRNGYVVVTPKDQVCCGAPLTEEGEGRITRGLARKNIDVFAKANVDVIVTDCAACGSEMKHYGDLLQDDAAYAERARAFSTKVRDINEFLAEVVPQNPPRGVLNKRVTYHEPCHLCHAQKVSAQPRRLLQSIPGVQYVEMKEANWCCGSAGIYTFTHPDYSLAMLNRKMNNAEATGAEIIASANPGCLMQLAYGAAQRGHKQQVRHVTQVLAEAYRLADSR